jgi:hypothetical protein
MPTCGSFAGTSEPKKIAGVWVRSGFHADDCSGFRDLAGGDRSFRGLYAGAEFRFEPLYLALGGVADPVERANYARLIEAINPFNLNLNGPAAPSAWNIGTTSGLMRLANEVQRQASMIGYINAFYLLALTAAIAVPFVWLMRARPPETS